ncbi:hypothetical protein ACIBF5_32000 [Micromonospora sp. NPDC050417]|uniref:hypothetical protein n=1 Tax=Micromonospora sp. NPDC050417 TaxID=3364280 RepID=UPI003795E71E
MERVRLGDPVDVDRLLRGKDFRADHPFRVSRRILGASTLDLEGSEHRNRKREWWAGFGKQWADSATAKEMVNSAVADGIAHAQASSDLLQGCVYIPNRIVLDLLGLRGVDPIEHYASLEPVIRTLGGFSEPKERLAQSREYIRRVAREVTVPLFSDLPDAARSAELALFLIAGAETTVVALKVITVAWWNDAAAVMDDVRHAGSRNVVMRLLTRDAPLGVTTRHASREVYFDKIGQIPRGALVDVDLAEASLLSAVDETDARRSSQSYVFGAGAHRCPGDRLAMLEAEAYLEGLLRLDASKYVPVAASEPRSSTFRHPTWQALTRTTSSRADSEETVAVGQCTQS